MKKIHYLATIAFIALGGSAFADQSPQPVQQHNSNAVWFENWIGLSNASMQIVDPNGKSTVIEAKSGTPVFKLTGSDIADGIYRYELSAATEEKQKVVNVIDNGRGDKASDTMAVPYKLSGFFTVSRGVIITPKEIKEE